MTKSKTKGILIAIVLVAIMSSGVASAGLWDDIINFFSGGADEPTPTEPIEQGKPELERIDIQPIVSCVNRTTIKSMAFTRPVNITKCYEETVEYLYDDGKAHDNLSYYKEETKCYTEQEQETYYKDVEVYDCLKAPVLEFNEQKLDIGNRNLYCKKYQDNITCDSFLDGNHDGVCQAGETCEIYSIDRDNLLTLEIAVNGQIRLTETVKEYSDLKELELKKAELSEVVVLR